MTQIRHDVPAPITSTKVCTKCFEHKLIEEFSLLRGKHSEDRKTYCVKCEGLSRKAKKLDITLAEFNSLMSKPCFVCGGESQHIDKSERINGVLCSRCWSFLKSVLPTDDHDIVIGCYNYLIFREKFPFWLKYQISLKMPEKPTPLFDGLPDA